MAYNIYLHYLTIYLEFKNLGMAYLDLLLHGLSQGYH